MSTNNRTIEPYLFFNGSCEEALDFYQKALGAEVLMKMRYKETPQPPLNLPPGFEDKICHASFRVGKTTVMASDGCEANGTKFEGFSLSLSVETEKEAQQVFAALSAGGKVTMPLQKTFWSPQFGMLEDRFGIAWMITMTPAQK